VPLLAPLRGQPLWGVWDPPELPPVTSPPSVPASAPPPAALPLPPIQPWTVASFTGLTRDRHASVAADDHALTPGGEPQDDLARLARGPAAGVLLHGVFEDHAWDAPADGERIRARLIRHGLADPAAHRDADPITTLITLLDQMSAMDLGGWRMGDAAHLRREWRFELPLRQLRPSALGRLFHQHGGDDGRAIAPALSRLRDQDLHGYLTGSIDLLTVAGDAWRIVDWKSNWLSESSHGYTGERCRAAMHGELYHLQAALYALAVRRWRARHGDPRPIHAHYVFLRGPHVVTWTPPTDLLDALDDLAEPAEITP
jgi:exodeoxyribonuclease V beta subunit